MRYAAFRADDIPEFVRYFGEVAGKPEELSRLNAEIAKQITKSDGVLALGFLLQLITLIPRDFGAMC
jgi:hypothetical protein